MSEKKIYLPDDKTQGILIDNAWQEFQEQMKENGMDFSGTEVIELLHDIFVAGYAFGHNDCLGIIRDQLTIDNWMNYTNTLNKN